MRNVTERTSVLALAILLASFAGCGDADDSDAAGSDGGATDEGDMWCGPLHWLFESTYQNWNITPENTPDAGNACFVIAYEPLEGDPSRPPDALRNEPVRVTYYLYFGPSVDDAWADCQFTGIDDNGSENGYSVNLDEDLSRCEWYGSSELSNGDRAYVFNPRVSGTLSQSRTDGDSDGTTELWFSLRASGRASLLLEEDGNWLFAHVFDQVGFSFNHDGQAFAASYTAPTWPRRGDCGADGCWDVQYGEPQILVGADFPGCQRIAEVSGSPTVTYQVRDQGRFADNGQAFQKFHAVTADTCSFYHQADDLWATTLDYDGGRAYVTYVGLPVDSDTGLNGECRILWEAPLVACP